MSTLTYIGAGMIGIVSLVVFVMGLWLTWVAAKMAYDSIITKHDMGEDVVPLILIFSLWWVLIGTLLIFIGGMSNAG